MQSIQASLDTARQAHSQQSGKDLSARLSSLHHSSLSPEAKEKKLREACEGFESIFIQKMWQEMRKTVNQGSFLHGREEQFWQDMYDQELAKKMTSAGGIGLANMMYEQLSSHLSSASRATARAQDNGCAFAPSQAPLLGNTALASTPLDLTGQTQAKAEGPKASPLYEEPKDVATSEKSPEKSASTPSGSSHPGESPVATAHPTPTASVEPPTPSVDPAIAQALDMMRHSVETNPQVSPAPLAHVNYTVPGARQQPVASGMDLAKAAQRQAGDQLGSRGVREPLLPQTPQARKATEEALARQEARHARRQPLPYAFPAGQAEAQDQEAQAAFAPMAQSTPLAPNPAEPKNQRPERAQRTARVSQRAAQNQPEIKTLNLTSPQAHLAYQSQAQAAMPAQKSSQEPARNTIPPLTAQDLQM